MRFAARAALVPLVGALVACPRPEPTPRPPGAAAAVEAHTDSSSVVALATVGPWLFVGSSAGLERWDLRQPGAPLSLGDTQGWPGGGVRALAALPDGSAVWVVAAGALLKVDAATGAVTLVSAPPPTMPQVLRDVRGLAVDPAGGVWVASAAGLYHADGAGAWLGAGYPRPLNAVWADATGDVLLGTDKGLVVRHADGSFHEQTADDGVDVGAVRFFVPGTDGSPIAVADRPDGKGSRLVLRAGGRFATFRPSPSVRFTAGARRLDEVLLSSDRRIYALSAPRGGARLLSRDGARLVPMVGAQRPPYAVRLADASLPPSVTALAASGEDIFAGTRTVGVARYAAGKTRPRWLQRADLAEGADNLSVTCRTARDCYVATGGARLWRFDGQKFAPASLPGATRVLAAVRGPGGAVTALYQADAERELMTARLEGAAWKPAVRVPLTTPGPLDGFAFARASVDGLLWVGLRYLDDEGERRPYGVATIELDLGVVTYHRQGEPSTGRRRVLPVPSDVTDVSFDFGGEEQLDVWFATESGAAHLSLPAETLEVFTEAEGLDSEILHAVAVSTGGVVYVATSRGVGLYDGERWSFPRALAMSARSLALGPDGRLWIGTDRGVVVYDGRRTQRVEARAGLLSEPIDHLAVDELGRVWALSTQGIGIITP